MSNQQYTLDFLKDAKLSWLGFRDDIVSEDEIKQKFVSIMLDNFIKYLSKVDKEKLLSIALHEYAIYYHDADYKFFVYPADYYSHDAPHMIDSISISTAIGDYDAFLTSSIDYIENASFTNEGLAPHEYATLEMIAEHERCQQMKLIEESLTDAITGYLVDKENAYGAEDQYSDYGI